MRQGYQARLTVLTLLVVVFFGGVLMRLFHLQVNRHDELLTKARKKYVSKRTTKGRRGSIYDSTRSPKANTLAMTRVTYEVTAEPRHMDNRKWEIFEHLVRETGANRSKLKARFENEKLVSVIVGRGITVDKVERLRDLKLPGVYYRESQTRFYPKNRLASNLIGFLNSDHKGIMGIESLFDEQMKPSSGEVVIERRARGGQSAQVSHTEHRDGSDVYLTLSEPIQSFLEEELDALRDKIPCKSAYAIMIDPRTGSIMAMAQRPTFNANDRSTMKRENYAPRMIEDVFEPGSIMKACSIGAVMSMKNFTFDKLIDCEGGYWPKYRLQDHGHEYGIMPVWKVIQKSSNIGTAKLADTIGEKAMYAGLRRFGFGERTGLGKGLGAESRGIFRHVNKWDGLSLSRMTIGQGIAVTPLQMVQAYGALANDGVMMKLRLVDKLKNEKTGEVKEFLPEVKHRVIPQRVAYGMTQALKTVTNEDGTAYSARVKGYEVAGKTGTAQKWVGKAYSERIHVASFIGYVPADDPAFVLMVVVDEPIYKYRFGGVAAAPYFSNIATKTLSYLNVRPDFPEELEDLDGND